MTAADAAGHALSQAAEDLCAAVRAHASRIVAAPRTADMPEVIAAGDELRLALVAYGDALLEVRGTNHPMAPLVRELHGITEAGPATEDLADEPQPGGTTVWVTRHEGYRVDDPAAVVEAGRAAYLRLWPDDDEHDAAAQVQGLGSAMYEIEHAGGPQALRDVPGLDLQTWTTAYDDDPPPSPWEEPT